MMGKQETMFDNNGFVIFDFDFCWSLVKNKYIDQTFLQNLYIVTISRREKIVKTLWTF